MGNTIKTLPCRLAKHISDAKYNSSKCARCEWLRELATSNQIPTIHLIEEAEGNGFAEEIKWIAHFKNQGCILVNSTTGGKGTNGLVRTPEQNKKISDALTGIKRSEKTKAKIRKARARQIFPSHTTPHSEETKALIRRKLSSPEVRKKIGAAKSIQTLCIKTGKMFKSGASAARWCHGTASEISHACITNKEYRGSKWKRIPNYFRLPPRI